LVASRGEDAVIMAEEDAFDLILCDIRMPGQNGVATIQQIKNLRGKKEIPVIFITVMPMRCWKKRQAGSNLSRIFINL